MSSTGPPTGSDSPRRPSQRRLARDALRAARARPARRRAPTGGASRRRSRAQSVRSRADQAGKASSEAVKPCRWLRPATGPSSPPAKKPATPSGASSLPHQRGVVVGAAVRRAEQVRAPAVAGEQQRAADRGVRGVARGSARAARAGRRRRPRRRAPAAARCGRPRPGRRRRARRSRARRRGCRGRGSRRVVLLGVLVQRDAEVQPGAGQRLVRRRQLREHLLDLAAAPGIAGELADHVAGRAP